MPGHPENILSIQGLVTEFHEANATVFRALDGIDLSIKSNEIHGLIGESGCGKTVMSMSVMRLIEFPGVIRKGTIKWYSKDLLKLTQKNMRKIRGGEIAMIFQDPQGALNPLYTIGDQLRTVIRLHNRGVDRNSAKRIAIKCLEEVELSNSERVFNSYSFEISGGQCQRVMIAMALACKPKLLIADEPTSALDVTVQAQILDLLMELRQRTGMSMLLISHDMAVVSNVCDRISVMYLGKIMEEAITQTLFENPKHPYTRLLLDSMPFLNKFNSKKHHNVTQKDSGMEPTPEEGCRFRNRCPNAYEKCSKVPLLRTQSSDGAKVACWLYDGKIH